MTTRKKTGRSKSRKVVLFPCVECNRPFRQENKLSEVDDLPVGKCEYCPECLIEIESRKVQAINDPKFFEGILSKKNTPRAGTGPSAARIKGARGRFRFVSEPVAHKIVDHRGRRLG